MATTTICSQSKTSATASTTTTLEWRRNAAPLSGPAPAPVVTSVLGRVPIRRSRQSSTSSQCWHTSSTSPPRLSSPLNKGLPSHGDLTLGSVLHLPAIPPDPSSIIFNGLTSEPFGHPIVVIGKSKVGGVEYVKMRICTTFGGRHISVARDTRFHKQFVLLDNWEDNAVHDGGVFASVESGSGRFDRRTYVSLVTEYTIEYKHLDPWAASILVTIDQASTQKLV